MVSIASFNVNSLRARTARVTEWLEDAKPDIACLQELKCTEEQLPRLELEALGYRIDAVGQKTYNGVALLTRCDSVTVTHSALPGDDSDAQARFIQAECDGLTVACLYLPNGNGKAEKLAYKHRWMDRLIAHASDLLTAEKPAILAGDFNVIPEPEDCWDPQAWDGDALFVYETRARFRTLLYQGWTDAFRALHGEPGQYTFWDYQAGRWDRDEGIRIDHLLLSPQAADRLHSCVIHRDPRGREKASDHTPIMVELSD